eukprot:CAMPEP_0177599952 /NCGR_PEP_ID=MMETSP0419_2-20121207/13317_1 /TAXON_ID=582737 /ORGANISM="Tetraselmis sp., Strain GSL018" /LENGTH=1591 /DNA_ID=CAMNT_0019092819 /DNA_START=347 /DNA_END=5122 /DNA_ORIENTATION=+
MKPKSLKSLTSGNRGRRKEKNTKARENKEPKDSAWSDGTGPEGPRGSPEPTPKKRIVFRQGRKTPVSMFSSDGEGTSSSPWKRSRNLMKISRAGKKDTKGKKAKGKEKDSDSNSDQDEDPEMQSPVKRRGRSQTSNIKKAVDSVQKKAKSPWKWRSPVRLKGPQSTGDTDRSSPRENRKEKQKSGFLSSIRMSPSNRSKQNHADSDDDKSGGDTPSKPASGDTLQSRLRIPTFGRQRNKTGTRKTSMDDHDKDIMEEEDSGNNSEGQDAKESNAVKQKGKWSPLKWKSPFKSQKSTDGTKTDHTHEIENQHGSDERPTKSRFLSLTKKAPGEAEEELTSPTSKHDKTGRGLMSRMPFGSRKDRGAKNDAEGIDSDDDSLKDSPTQKSKFRKNLPGIRMSPKKKSVSDPNARKGGTGKEPLHNKEKLDSKTRSPFSGIRLTPKKKTAKAKQKEEGDKENIGLSQISTPKHNSRAIENKSDKQEDSMSSESSGTHKSKARLHFPKFKLKKKKGKEKGSRLKSLGSKKQRGENDGKQETTFENKFQSAPSASKGHEIEAETQNYMPRPPPPDNWPGHHTEKSSTDSEEPSHNAHTGETSESSQFSNVSDRLRKPSTGKLEQLHRKGRLVTDTDAVLAERSKARRESRTHGVHSKSGRDERLVPQNFSSEKNETHPYGQVASTGRQRLKDFQEASATETQHKVASASKNSRKTQDTEELQQSDFEKKSGKSKTRKHDSHLETEHREGFPRRKPGLESSDDSISKRPETSGNKTAKSYVPSKQDLTLSDPDQNGNRAMSKTSSTKQKRKTKKKRTARITEHREDQILEQNIQVLKVTILRTGSLEPVEWLTSPLVRMHIVNQETGEYVTCVGENALQRPVSEEEQVDYLRKPQRPLLMTIPRFGGGTEDSSAAGGAPSDGSAPWRAVTVDFIPAVQTNPYDLRMRPGVPLVAEWDEQVVIDSNVQELLKTEAMLLFEVLQAPESMRGASREAAMQPLAWAFLKLKNGDAPVTGSLLLQLYTYGPSGNGKACLRTPQPPLGKRVNRQALKVYSQWWKQQFARGRGKYPSFLKVRVDIVNREEPEVVATVPQKNVRPSTLLGGLGGYEIGRYDLLEEAGLGSTWDGRPGSATDGIGNSSDGDLDDAQEWRKQLARAGDEDCKVPNKLFKMIPGEQLGATRVAFAHSSTMLAIAFGGSSLWGVQVWEVLTDTKMISHTGHHDMIYDLSWSADDSSILTASSDFTAKIWDVSQLDELKPRAPVKRTQPVCLQHPCFVYCSAFHPVDETLIVTGCYDKALYIWDWHSKPAKILSKIQVHCAPINTLTFDARGLRLFTGDGDGFIRVWSAEIRPQISTEGFRFVKLLDQLRDEPITSLQMHRNNRRLLVLTKRSRMVTFDVAKLFSINSEYPGIKCTHNPLKPTFSPDGRYIISGSEDGRVYMWSIENKEPDHLKHISSRDPPVCCVSWSSQYHCLAICSFRPFASVKVYTYQDYYPSVELSPGKTPAIDTYLGNISKTRSPGKGDRERINLPDKFTPEHLADMLSSIRASVRSRGCAGAGSPLREEKLVVKEGSPEAKRSSLTRNRHKPPGRYEPSSEDNQ